MRRYIKHLFVKRNDVDCILLFIDNFLTDDEMLLHWKVAHKCLSSTEYRVSSEKSFHKKRAQQFKFLIHRT